MNKETHTRSGLKSFIWRIVGVVILASITYFYTHKWIQTSLITVIHHGIFLVVYYLHERLWLWIGDKVKGKKRYFFRVFLYEIILGQGILGIISFIVTGNLQIASLITITYIGNKLWIYFVYDKLWEKIQWGINKVK